jgi:predicted transposase YdaD
LGVVDRSGLQEIEQREEKVGRQVERETGRQKARPTNRQDAVVEVAEPLELDAEPENLVGGVALDQVEEMRLIAVRRFKGERRNLLRRAPT